MRPRLGTLQIIGLALLIETVPRVEEVTDVLLLPLVLRFYLIFGDRFRGILVIVREFTFLLAVIRLGLLLILRLNVLEQVVHPRRRHQ